VREAAACVLLLAWGCALSRCVWLYAKPSQSGPAAIMHGLEEGVGRFGPAVQSPRALLCLCRCAPRPHHTCAAAAHHVIRPRRRCGSSALRVPPGAPSAQVTRRAHTATKSGLARRPRPPACSMSITQTPRGFRSRYRPPSASFSREPQKNILRFRVPFSYVQF
jgi:hypothetical protein